MSAHSPQSLFHIARVPFSRFGSWMSVAIPRDEKRVFLRNYHNGPHNLFPLLLLETGQESNRKSPRSRSG